MRVENVRHMMVRASVQARCCDIACLAVSILSSMELNAKAKMRAPSRQSSPI